MQLCGYSFFFYFFSTNTHDGLLWVQLSYLFCLEGDDVSNKWVRSISFNKNNSQDVERLKLIGKKSFSRYIKKLLDEELKRKKLVVSDTTRTATPQPQRQKIPPTSTKPVTAKPQIFNPMLRK